MVCIKLPVPGKKHKILLGGVRTSCLDQNAPHDFLYIPQLWEIYTTSVQPTAELRICLYLTVHYLKTRRS